MLTLSAMIFIAGHPSFALAPLMAASGAEDCGEILSIETHDRTTTRISLNRRDATASSQDALILLIGGGGNLDLDDRGCPRALSRNVLMRMRPRFHQTGFATALVDAPSDSMSGDGLAGFRVDPKHAEDMAKVIAAVRARTKGAVWLVGHSRGTLSAANAGVRLKPPAAPDGLVLLSAMMVGDPRAKKTFVAQTLFHLPLESMDAPALILGHAADNCVRSPARMMDDIAARSKSSRTQVVTVTGGPVASGRAASLSACEVGEPHDFVAQETEVGAGIVRFVRGEKY